MLGKSPDKLTIADIQSAGKLHVFEVFTKHQASAGKYFHIGFTWLLLFGAVALLVWQGFVLFR